MRCFTSVEAMAPANFLGLPIMSSGPNLVHQPRAGHSWELPTLEGGEKEQKEDLHPRQVSALAEPPRRKQSLEGYKEKGPPEYLNITHPMGSGDGEERLCRWDKGWCHGQLPGASATRRSHEQRAPTWLRAGGTREAGSWVPGLSAREGTPPPQHRHQLPTTEHGRGPLFRSLHHLSVLAVGSYRQQ